MRKNIYKINAFAYDEYNDELAAQCYLLRDCTMTPADADQDPADSLERFSILINFGERVHTIADMTEHAGDIEFHYQPLVLACFLRTFERAYEALGHENSPADVKLETFEVPVGLFMREAA